MTKVSVDKEYLDMLEKQNLELREKVEEADKLKSSIYKIKSSTNISSEVFRDLIVYPHNVSNPVQGQDFIMRQTERAINDFSDQIVKSIAAKEMGNISSLQHINGNYTFEISLEVVAPVLVNRLERERKIGIEQLMNTNFTNFVKE